MKLIDAHTHLNTEPLFQNRQGYMQQFIDAGGIGLVNSGASESYNINGIEIAKIAERDFKNCVVKTTLGRHPGECCMEESSEIITQDTIEKKMNELKTLYSVNKEYIVAIGECGIDLHYPGAIETLDLQKKLFVLHCDLAQELNLPLMVHSRDAFDETFDILKNYTDLTIYFHCRGYGPNEFRMLNSEFRNLYVGFCGNVTYKNAEELRETLKIIPLTQLLLETDAPWLSPQVVRGQTNHSANVRYIYDFVADYLQIAPEALSQQIETNFHSVYKF